MTFRLQHGLFRSNVYYVSVIVAGFVFRLGRLERRGGAPTRERPLPLPLADDPPDDAPADAPADDTAADGRRMLWMSLEL